MRIGVGLSIPELATRGGRFSPASLFTSGVAGAWYDPSDVLLNWRTNLLTYTQEFDNAAWTKVSLGVTANAASAPDSTTTADKITPNAGGVTPYLHQTYTTAAVAYVVSFYAKADGYNFVQISDGVSATDYCNFNLSTGAVGNSVGYTGSIQNAGNGWYRCIVTRTFTAASTELRIEPLSTDAASRRPSFVADGTSAILLWGAQLELGSTATTYQAITTPEQTYLLYDPQPVLYQDSSGTTPVTAVEQPVGLMLDKSQGLVLGSELVTNGDFSVGTGWSTGGVWVISGGSASITSSTTSLSQSTLSAVVGTWYQVTFTISAFTAGGVRVEFGGVNGASRTAAGTYTQYILATSTSFLVISPIAISTLSIDNVSIKVIPGNHASQATAASRPVLRARYNLLTYSEQFDNAAWFAGLTTVSANQATAPDGTVTADLVYVATTGASRYIWRNASVFTASAQVITSSFYVKASSWTWVMVNGTGTNTGVWFNIATGQKGTESAGCTGTISDAGNGWWRCTVTETRTGTVQPTVFLCDANNSLTATASGTNGVYLWGAQLVTGSSAGTYQRIAAATDYATAGFLPYLYFVTDDSFGTNSIDFTGTNQMSVCAGITKLSDAATAMLCELSADSNSNNGSFYLAAPISIGAAYRLQIGGTSRISLDTAAYAAPVTQVITAANNIATPIATATVNKTTTVSTAASQGTGNFGNYPLYIGRRNNASLPFNGNFYQLIVCGKTLSASELASTEAYVATKTGVTL